MSGFDPFLSRRLDRRSLMTGASVLAVAAAGHLPKPLYAAQGQSFSGKITIEAHDYTPSESMEVSEDNPIPHDALQRAADAYIQQHPEVEIEFIRIPPGTESRVWAVTQLTGERAPDILWTQSFDANRDEGKGWWVELDQFFTQPNPYVEAGAPGSAQWIDQFFEIPTGSKYAPSGHIYVVPYDLVTTFFFYNKTHFTEAGVEPPTSWDGFIGVLKALQGTGKIPYNGMQWSQPQLGEMVVHSWAEQFEPTGAGGAYTQKDVTLAILAGIFDATKPEYKDWMRLRKETVPYWTQIWSREDPQLGDQMARDFVQGNMSIYEDGSWRFGLLQANTDVAFEWGNFFMPTLMQGTGEGFSEFANGSPAPAIGGATANQFGITNTAVKNGTVDLCVDFLRFISAPAQASEIIGELGQFLPNIKGVDVNQDLAPALEAVTTGVAEAGMITYGDKIDAEAGDKITTVTNSFLLDRTDLDDAAQQIQDLLFAQAETVADAQGWR